MRVLALNSGSNSLKFEIVDVARPNEFGRSLIAGAYDYIGKPQGTFTLLDGSRPIYQEQKNIKDYGGAATALCQWVESGGAADRGVDSLGDIECVGHRVVHGADLFDAPALIDEGVIKQIEELADLAPLHNQPALAVIRAVNRETGQRVPAVAVFDTVFHRTLPDAAALYALPRHLAERYRIRRYGFHGISHRYLLLRYAQIARRASHELKLVTAHLEGGSSLAAIRNGQSVETSMGFTPLEGLVMGTRSGDLDPAIVPYLMRKEQMDAQQALEFFNKRCGLLGLSGESADTRELVKKIDMPAVNLAIDIFCHRVRKYLGAYLAVLGGADAIVLGGGISENTPLIRERICRNLEWLGIALDEAQNQAVIDREGPITSPAAKLPVWVIPSRENLMVASESAGVLGNGTAIVGGGKQ